MQHDIVYDLILGIYNTNINILVSLILQEQNDTIYTGLNESRFNFYKAVTRM